MPFTADQIERAAAAAAEKANGGRFIDPLFHAEEHRQFWREVVKAASCCGWRRQVAAAPNGPEEAAAAYAEAAMHRPHARPLYDA